MRSRSVKVVAALAWIELATALQVVRMPHQTWRALWAEDGVFFLPEAVAHPVRSLLATHAGYYSLVCRIMGSLASVAPATQAATVLNVGGAAAASIVSVYVYVASGDVFRSWWARGLMAALTVLGPAAVFEVGVNSVDLHWYFLFGCFWAAWSIETRPGRVAADSVIAGLAAWSSVLSLFFAPLFLRRLLRVRGWQRWVVPLVYGVGAAAQVLYVLTHKGEAGKYSAVYLPDIPKLYALRVAGGLLVGDAYLKPAWLSLGLVLLAIVLTVVLAVTLYGLVVCDGRRLFIAAAAGYSVVLTVASLGLRGTGSRVSTAEFTLAGSRYFFVPVLLLAAAFIAVGDSAQGRRWAAAIPIVLVAGVAATNVSVANVREGAPNWRTSVIAARAQCHTPDQMVTILVPPLDGTWLARLPCRKLGP